MEKDTSFVLPDGIDIPDVSGLKNAYSVTGEGSLSALLSAEKLMDFITAFTELIPEPVFFFLELPCSTEEEKELRKSESDPFHYKLYYLDNCTRPVIRALIKDYGSMLINDGICRFGFGGNQSGDEIYVQSYKVMSLYCAEDGRTKKTESLLGEFGAEKVEELVTPWEIISKDNPGTCVRAEEDGISPYDLPEMFRKAGMYYAETV